VRLLIEVSGQTGFNSWVVSQEANQESKQIHTLRSKRENTQQHITVA
jgi:hypothetical protein